MKKQISAILDKILSKGMELMESERAQQILSSPQAQKALDLGMAALSKANEVADCLKAGLASRLGLATQKEIDELRDTIARLESDRGACCCCDASDDAKAIDAKDDAKDDAKADDAKDAD